MVVFHSSHAMAVFQISWSGTTIDPTSCGWTISQEALGATDSWYAEVRNLAKLLVTSRQTRGKHWIVYLTIILRLLALGKQAWLEVGENNIRQKQTTAILMSAEVWPYERRASHRQTWAGCICAGMVTIALRVIPTIAVFTKLAAYCCLAQQSFFGMPVKW